MDPVAQRSPAGGRRLGPFRRARRLLFYLCARGLVGLVRRLPRPVAAAPLRALARLAFVVRPGDRRTADRQLAMAFPGLDARQRTGLYRRSLLVLADNLVDAARDEAPLLVGEAEAATLERVVRSGRPVLLLMGHLGCFELVGRRLGARLGRFAALTANPHNRRVDRWLRAEREAAGVRCFDRRRELRAAARWLRDGGTLAVLADYRGGAGAIEAPWFGRGAPTPAGAARMAQGAGALLLPVGSRREAGGHRLRLGEPIDPAGLELPALVGHGNAALERLVRESPEGWTWFHDRYGDAN